MVAKHLAQIIIVGAQIVGRAFARALRQEYVASQAAARKAGGGQSGRATASADAQTGISLQEAMQILNLNDKIDPEKTKNNFDHLFSVNDKSKGGSFYIQSKKQLWTQSRNCFQCHRFCTLSSLMQQTANFHTVFSEDNKQMCIKRMQKVEPARGLMSSSRQSAAVLVPLCSVSGVPSVLLTLRSPLLAKHRGEISFPGGLQESDDTDLIHTALRETEEELGISACEIDIWGEMCPVPSRTGEMAIVPVLGYVKNFHYEKLKISDQEVEEAFTVSLETLCNPNNWHSTQFRTGKGYTLPSYTGGKYRIWGLTAIIMHMALLSLVPKKYKHKLHHIYSLVKS